MSAPRSVVLNPRTNNLALKACSINTLKKSQTKVTRSKLSLESALCVQSLSVVNASPFTTPSSTTKSSDRSEMNYNEEKKQEKREIQPIKVSTSAISVNEARDLSQESEGGNDGIQEEEEFKEESSPSIQKQTSPAPPPKQKEIVKEVSKQEKEYPIPTHLPTTREHIANRKYFDEIRWFCVVRPQYQRNCGIASLTAVFNYLFSTLGYGTLPVLSQQEAMSVLGFKPPFDEIKFGAFAGNGRLFTWFKALMKHFNVNGDCGYYFKPVGKGNKQSEYSTGPGVLKALKKDLRRQDFALIYHCFNHYFCPIGYQCAPVVPHQAFAPEIEGQTEHTLIIGDSSKKFKTIQAIPWQEVIKDLTLKNPRYFDVRRPQEGVQCKEQKQKGQNGETNCHCLMYFKRTT